MRYRHNIKFNHEISKVILFFLCSISIILQTECKKLRFNSSYYHHFGQSGYEIKRNIIEILGLNTSFNATQNVDPFFGLLLGDFAKIGDLNASEIIPGINIENITVSYENLKGDDLQPTRKLNVQTENMFDWGNHFKLDTHEFNEFGRDSDIETRVSGLFLSFFDSIRKEGISNKRKIASTSFKEVVVPDLMDPVFNFELEDQARAILTNELLIDSRKIGKAYIPKTRPDGLPSMLFIGIESNAIPLNVIYQKKTDSFLFRTFKGVDLPKIPSVAGERLKKWVTLKYKEIYDSIARKALSDKESYNTIELIDKYGIFFIIEFKDDAVCFLSKVTLFDNIIDGNAIISPGYYSRVTRLLFVRLRPFISLISSFTPLEISEFRSLSFIGSPILMSIADSKEDALTQQVLYYWSYDSEKLYSDYNRRNHVCSERELYQNLEYENLCLIHPKCNDPRNPETLNNGYLVTISCFGLQPIGTIALYTNNSQYLLKTCMEDGKWSDASILTNTERANIILYKCRSRNNLIDNVY